MGRGGKNIFLESSFHYKVSVKNKDGFFFQSVFFRWDLKSGGRRVPLFQCACFLVVGDEEREKKCERIQSCDGTELENFRGVGGDLYYLKKSGRIISYVLAGFLPGSHELFL
jgi:hypothetical protein